MGRPLIDRRQLLLGLGLAACTRPQELPAEPAPAVRRAGGAAAKGAVEVHSVFDLASTDPRSRELSGIAWEASAGLLWAVQDESAGIVALRPDKDLRTWSIASAITVTAAGPLDLEGIAVTKTGFYICSEEGPRLLEVDRSGRVRRELTLPERMRGARTNKSLESLTMSPSGRYLFTTTEVALPCDGAAATAAAGTILRILRVDLQDGAITEHAYDTDPAPYVQGDWGVADLAAVSDDELLVLERGWTRGKGNTARIYGAQLDEQSSCGGIPALSPGSPQMKKELRVDLGRLLAPLLPAPKQPQASPLLDNYEGLAIGPRLPDGRSTLIVVTDDNGHANQVARILVLAWS